MYPSSKAAMEAGRQAGRYCVVLWCAYVCIGSAVSLLLSSRMVDGRGWAELVCKEHNQFRRNMMETQMMDGWVHACTDGWVHVWMGRWADEWIHTDRYHDSTRPCSFMTGYMNIPFLSKKIRPYMNYKKKHVYPDGYLRPERHTSKRRRYVHT